MKPEIQVLISSALIALTPILGRIGTRMIHPALFAFYDMVIATIGMSIIYLLRRPKMKKDTSKDLLLAGVFFGIGVLLYFTSLSITTAVNVAFLGQFQLIFIILLSVLVLKERVSNKKLIGAVIVLIGGAFIIYEESINFDFGWLFALLAFFFYSLVNMYRKKASNKKANTIIMLLINTLIPSLMLLVYILLLGLPFLINEGLFYVVINAIVVDVAGAYLFVNSLEKMPLSKAFIIMLMMPLFTLIYSFIIFGFNINLFQLVGGALLIGGNVLSNKSEKTA